MAKFGQVSDVAATIRFTTDLPDGPYYTIMGVNSVGFFLDERPWKRGQLVVEELRTLMEVLVEVKLGSQLLHSWDIRSMELKGKELSVGQVLSPKNFRDGDVISLKVIKFDRVEEVWCACVIL